MAASTTLPGLSRFEVGANPEQLRAIRHGEGPCVLFAQAGSGKTFALVNRIARLVDDGVDPAAICSVTFSNKAALEMNERLSALGVDDARVGTWHSLCLQILREDGTRWAQWEVDKTDRAKTILKEVLGYKHLNWRDADLGQVARFIGACKANLAGPGTDEALALAEESWDLPEEVQRACDAFELFQKLVEERGLLRFDDFLVFAHAHLSIEENRLKWAARWDYLLVDECQDDAPAQVVLREFLAREHRNLFVVGDPSQSIYSFRGSSPKHLVDFPKQWEGCEEITMNRNYRSGKSIVAVANKVIAPAEVRLPTDMVGEREAEGLVECKLHDDLDDEGRAFAEWVLQLVAGGEKLSTACALFRTNAQSRALEEGLLTKKIPYVVVGGSSFYERKEVKDLLAYLRVAAGRDNDEGDAVRRSVNAPFRYLGHAFVERLQNMAGDWAHRVELAGKAAGIQGRQRASAAEWVAIVKAAKLAIERGDKPAAILNDVIHKTGFISWLEQDQGEESVENSHAANVREMARIAERFVTVGELLDYLDDMAAAAKRKSRTGAQDRVVLMSIHKSKGLEWKNVWVSGCNEKVLPHAKGDPEEERRLMYVACTRARDRLVLSHVRRFAQREGVKAAEPSRFLRDAGFLQEIKKEEVGL